MSFDDDARITLDALSAFADHARRRDGKVVNQPPAHRLMANLDIARLIAEGGLEGERLRQFLATYLGASTRLLDPRYMAHQVAVPSPHSALAALVDSFTNNAMAIYEMGPAAATIEMGVLDWMLGKIGWAPDPAAHGETAREGGGGVLTHGGSLANLTALLAARARVAPRAWDEGTPSDLVILCSPANHYSIARAAGIMGLGQRAVKYVPADACGRIDAARLPAFLDAIARDGLQPIALVANACSTALGLYDPLRDIAGVCRDRGIWLHVDGAHGASALVSPRLRHLLDGVDLADSLVWDAHKMLRSATLSAAVLVRDYRTLDHAFREEASYLFHDKDQPGFDFIHRTVECTKAAIGLKVFFALAHEGEGAIAAMIERQTVLAKDAARRLREEPGMEVAVEPETNIVCFRFDGTDDLQIELRRRLVEHGEFYISTAEALGKRWLRVALMNPSTELTDIEALVVELRRLRAEIDATGA